jgi:hypothetical protein
MIRIEPQLSDSFHLLVFKAVLTGCFAKIQDPLCNPWLSGNACYGKTIWLSFLSRKRDFPGRSVIQALLLAARRRWH